jgi:hypothetical protein
MLRLMRKGQSTAEYAIVIGLVIAAAVAMQIYVKRGVQSKVKSAVDYVDSDASDAGILPATGQSQYEPYYMTTDLHSTRNAEETENMAAGGTVTRTTDDVSTRTGSQTVTEAE